MEPTQHVLVSGTTIISAVIGVFGFVVSLLIGIIGYFIVSDLKRRAVEKIAEKAQYDSDRKQDLDGRILMYKQAETDRAELAKKVDADKESFEARVSRVAELFATQLKAVGAEFMVEIKEIKNKMGDISQAVSNLTNNFVASEKRLDRQHEEIEMLRSRSHDSSNAITALQLKMEQANREREQIMAKNKLKR